MRSCRHLSTLIALSLPFCLPLRTHAAEITISLKDAAVEWLAAEGITDASAHLKVLIAAEKPDQQTLAAARRDFEKAILNGKPFDPKKHSLAVALNLLRLDNFSCSVAVQDYKEAGVTAFAEKVVPTVHCNGSYLSDVHVGAIPGLRGLEKAEYRFIELSAKADQFEVKKDRAGTARLVFTLKMTVESKNSKAEYHFTLGPWRITAWQDAEWHKLPKWKE
jgi:hypothetical protein